MVFVPAPKATMRVSFPESRMLFKHLLCTMGLDHDLCIFNRITFGDIDLEMNMNCSKTEFTKLKSKPF